MDCAISPRSRAALLTVDLVLVPVRLPPFVRASFAETLRFVNEANTFRPRLRTRIVLNRRTRTTSMPMRLHKRSPSGSAGADKLHRPARRPRRGGSDRPARVRDGPQRSSRPEELRSRPKSKGWRDDDPRSQENVHGARL